MDTFGGSMSSSEESSPPRCGNDRPPYPLMDLDLIIGLQFFDNGRHISFNISSSSSIQYLMSVIRACVRPHDHSDDEPIEIRDNAMFIFRGEDLRTIDAFCTLSDLGMKEQAEIFIIHPGPLVKGSVGSKSSNLFSLVRDVKQAAKLGTPVDKFLETAKKYCVWESSVLPSLVRKAKKAAELGISLDRFVETAKNSCDWKNIFVEIPVCEGLDLLITVKAKLTYQIRDVKGAIRNTILQTYRYEDVDEACMRLGEFDLLLGTICLDPEVTVAKYPIKAHDKLKVLRKSNAIQRSVALSSNISILPKSIKIDPFDSVRKTKDWIHQITGVPPDKQLLKYQNRWLVDDSKNFVDYGICFYFHDVFKWLPPSSDLETLILAWPCGSSNLDPLSRALEIGGSIPKRRRVQMGIEDAVQENFQGSIPKRRRLQMGIDDAIQEIFHHSEK